VLRIRTSLGLAAVALAAACNDGTAVEPPATPDASTTATGPNGAAQTPAPQDTARGPSTPPSTTPRGDSIGVTIAPSPYLAPGGTATLTAFRLSNTSASTPIPNVVWESADPKVATVANGVVTAVALGIAPIRAQIEGRWLQLFVTVTADGQRPQPRPAPDTGSTRPPTDSGRGPATPPGAASPRDSAAISVTPGNALLAPGRTLTLGVRRYSGGAWIPATGAAFASANPAVATVSASGVVTGVAVGTTSVRVTVGEIFVILPIVVTADGQPPQRTPTDTAGRGPSTPPAYVGEFTLGGRVFDATPGPDSATYKPIVGVTLTLVAVDQAGQPLSPERVAGTATTDAAGRFTLPKAPGGWYRLDVTPPAGSGYRFSSVLVSRPVRETLQYDLALRKQP
jgi:hypothetical protein